MTKWIESRLIWGLLLIIAGGLFLLQNLGFFTASGLVWAGLFGLGGLFFLSIFIQSRQNWWGLIPGIALLAIALLIVLDTIFPSVSGVWGGGIVLGGIGLAFLAVYLANQANWWALIPMGVMLTLAGISVLDQISGMDTGGIFFLGLGATFALVAILPVEGVQLRWAWIPAGVLLLMGVLLTMESTLLMGFLGPAILILAGLFFIIRAARR